MKSKSNGCVIGLDPSECWVQEQCRYWSRELRRCRHAAIAEAELKRRLHAEEDERADVMKRIRLTPR